MLLSATGTDFDPVSRLLLLEVIELRTMEWKNSPKVENYYKQKLAQLDVSG